MRMSEEFNLPIRLDVDGLLEDARGGDIYDMNYEIAHAINNHDKLLDRVDELEKLIYLVRADLLARGENDKESGVLHINLRHELWQRLEEVAKEWQDK